MENAAAAGGHGVSNEPIYGVSFGFWADAIIASANKRNGGPEPAWLTFTVALLMSFSLNGFALNKQTSTHTLRCGLGGPPINDNPIARTTTGTRFMPDSRNTVFAIHIKIDRWPGCRAFRAAADESG